jgi:hypothetical protein
MTSNMELSRLKQLLILVSLCCLFAMLRMHITPRLNLPTLEGSFEAFSHLFVGGLFGAWLISRDRQLLWSGIGISLFELIMFIIQKWGHA